MTSDPSPGAGTRPGESRPGESRPGESRPGDLGPFLREAPGIADGLAAAVEALGGDHPAAALDSLALLSHRLYGSASLYGLDAIAELADGMGAAVAALALAPEGELKRGRRVLADAVTALGGALEAARAGDEGDDGGDGAVGDDLLARLADLAALPAPRSPAADPMVERLRAAAADNPDVLEYFEPEAREQAEGIAVALAELREGRTGRAPVETAFRLVHTLKGAAYMVECEPFGELAHAMEDLLEPARHGRLRLDDPALGALEDAHDVLQRMLAALTGEPVWIEAAEREVRDRLARLRPGSEEPAEVTAEQAPPPPPIEERTAGGSPPVAATEPPAEAAPPAAPVASAPPAPAEFVPPAETAAAPPAPGRTIRVGLDRIDGLGQLVGEAMISRGRMEHHLERLGEIEQQYALVRDRMVRTAEAIERRRLDPGAGAERTDGAGAARRPADAPALALDGFSELELDRYDELDVLTRQVAEISFDLGETQGLLAGVSRELSGEIERTARLLRRLRGSVGRTRMLPLGRLLERFRRRVERGGRERGTPVRGEVTGRQVEVDTVIVERLADPLLHLVNNALIHGIESPEERRRAGKPAEGTIALRAVLRGVFVDLEVEDDGRGLDPDRLRRRAVDLGLTSADEVARMPDSEAIELIFRPGFTTAPRLTGDAGRGIGMDVVRSVVRDLNGQIRTESLPGRGTRFTLRLPATLVVSTALKVRVGSEVLALPTVNVRRLLQADPGRLEAHDGREWLPLEDERIEVLRLGRLLGLAAEAPGAALPLAVVQAPGRSLALAIDELLGIEEVVVQGLGGLLEGLDGFAGVTVSPDGGVVLVLDPATVTELTPAADRPAAAATEREAAAESAGPPILLADDSISVRKVLGRQLTAAGYEVVTAHDGEQALAALRERPFAALITDIEMPRLNGFELLEMVRRRPAGRELPTVVITTRSSAKHRDLATRLGAAAYLGKPIDREALLAVLAEVTAPHGAGAGAAAAGARAARGGQRPWEAR